MPKPNTHKGDTNPKVTWHGRADQFDAMDQALQKVAPLERITRLWITGNMTADDAMKQVRHILGMK